MKLIDLAWMVAPKWALRRHLIPALEVSAMHKIMNGEPLHDMERAIVVDALKRIRVGRPGAEAAMSRLLAGDHG